MIKATDIHKSYGALEVLRGVSLEVSRGEVVSIVGASGAGKTTLLQILGTLSKADRGSVEIDGQDVSSLGDRALSRFRNEKIGFVFQFHHLLPEFTALENAAMPLLIRRTPKEEALAKAEVALDVLGLSERLTHLPSQLSGGERQRTAIARAMVADPACILADEPTGNLDRDTALEVFDCLVKTAKAKGTAVVIVTHDLQIASRCDRVLRLAAGVIEEVSGV